MHKTKMHHHQQQHQPRACDEYFLELRVLLENCFVAKSDGVRFYKCTFRYFVSIAHSLYKFINVEIVKNIACVWSAAVEKYCASELGLDFCNHTELVLSHTRKKQHFVCSDESFVSKNRLSISHFLFCWKKRADIKKCGNIIWICVSKIIQTFASAFKHSAMKFDIFSLETQMRNKYLMRSFPVRGRWNLFAVNSFINSKSNLKSFLIGIVQSLFLKEKIMIQIVSSCICAIDFK